MIDFTRFTPQALSDQPYRWAFIDQLFSPADKEALVRTFPRDHFKTVEGYDGEKGYQYEARSLIGMGAGTPTNAEFLSPIWRSFAEELLTPAYRRSMSQLTQLDLDDLPMEINVFHYGRSAWLGPHVDLEDKVVTHVFYFNEIWNETDGGCLAVLRSADMADAVRIIPPVAGNSVVLVRSQNSWHAVTPVRDNSPISRRSMTITFYRPGSLSTLWPAGDAARLHDYSGEHSALFKWVQEKGRRIRLKMRTTGG